MKCSSVCGPLEGKVRELVSVSLVLGWSTNVLGLVLLQDFGSFKQHSSRRSRDKCRVFRQASELWSEVLSEWRSWQRLVEEAGSLEVIQCSWLQGDRCDCLTADGDGLPVKGLCC